MHIDVNFKVCNEQEIVTNSTHVGTDKLCKGTFNNLVRKGKRHTMHWLEFLYHKTFANDLNIRSGLNIDVLNLFSLVYSVHVLL